MQVIKELKDCLFLLMITNQTIMKFLLILSKNIFFQKNHNIEIDGRNFYDQPINDLINNTTKSEKYQKDKVMITPLVACCILLILEKIAD